MGSMLKDRTNKNFSKNTILTILLVNILRLFTNLLTSIYKLFFFFFIYLFNKNAHWGIYNYTFKIEKILSRKVIKDKIYYEVRWLGYDKELDSLIPAKDLIKPKI